MADAPERCTACGTPLLAGELRCRQCGKIYGADNDCARCGNTAGVRRTADGYRCLACNAPRERKPGTIVSEGDPLVGGPGALAYRGAAGVFRALGVASIAGGLLVSAGLFVGIGGVAGGALAAAVFATGAGIGALFLRGGARSSAAANQRVRTERELAILRLATERSGVLTVTDVATALGLASADAEAALDAMADGARVSAEVTSDGRIEYVFRELVASGPKVRVEVGGRADATEEVEAAAGARREERSQ